MTKQQFEFVKARITKIIRACEIGNQKPIFKNRGNDDYMIILFPPVGMDYFPTSHYCSWMRIACLLEDCLDRHGITPTIATEERKNLGGVSTFLMY